MNDLLKLDFRRFKLNRVNLAQFDPRQRQPGAGLLGLALDGSRLEGAWVRRTNGSVEIRQTLNVALSLDPLTAEPELAGREIRKQLDAAEIRERRCAVCVPTAWVLCLTSKLPEELSDADLPGFLQIEAERGFPYDIASLVIAQSRFRTPDGGQFITQMAIPRAQLERLVKVLEAAQLRPLSLTLGPTAWQPAPTGTDHGIIAVDASENGLNVLITLGGGVVALRQIEGAFETQGADRQLQTDHVLREFRITRGQLPPEISEATWQVRVLGAGETAREIAEELSARLRPQEIEVEPVRRYAAEEFTVKVPAETLPSPAVSLAVRQLAGQAAPFEFLPPRISAWQQFKDKYSTGKLAHAGLAVGAVALVIALAFLFQQAQIWYWGAKWSTMRQQVKELETIQSDIRRYRPWFDESCRSLSILRRLTEAFPEDGTVSAKSIEIRDPATVTCTGTARDNTAWLKTLDRLRGLKEVSNVQVEQIKGTRPMQFTFHFQWTPGGAQ